VPPAVSAPASSDARALPAVAGAASRPPSKTSLATEGPLVLFTLLAATLAGLMPAPLGREMLADRVFGVPVFLFLAAAAAGSSTLHLGRKGRAWRAVLNLRRSWLSREIALFGAFVVVSTAVLVPGLFGLPLLGSLVATHLPAPPVASWASTVAALLGFGLLFAVDRVYGVTATRGLPLHSARVALTGLMVAGIGLGSAPTWGGVLTVKVVSYVVRKSRFVDEGLPARWGWTVLRVGAALGASGLLVVSMVHGFVVDVVGASAGCGLLALGEVVDRGEFYVELEV